MNRCLAACITMAIASTVVSSGSLASPNGGATILVQYDDLDLSTSAGRKILDRRIQRAADEACLAAAGPAPGQQVDLPCVAEAIASARAQVAQAVAEQHQSKSHAVAETEPH
jgi:UrcA family protein